MLFVKVKLERGKGSPVNQTASKLLEAVTSLSLERGSFENPDKSLRLASDTLGSQQALTPLRTVN